jgi:tetratricopeptide (TPR) repeat protein
MSRSTAEFELAVSLDPGFPEAHCDLGVAYMAQNRPEEAAAEFRRAIELDPAISAYHANLAAVLTALGRPDEGEAEARTAIGLDSAYAKAHLLLGLLLARRPETRRAAESHLAYASRQLPVARTALESLYQAEGGSQGGEP